MVQIIDHPISVQEAIVAPFKRIGNLVSGKIKQITGTAENQLDAAVQQSMTHVTTAGTTGPAGQPTRQGAAPNRGLLAGGLLAGGGLALAALGSAAAIIIEKLAGLDTYQIIAGIGAALPALLLPTIVLAMVKLRRRDLSAILEGAGWAINSRMRLTRAQCRQFTQRPAYPRRARGLRTWRLWAIAVLVCGLIAAGAGYRAWVKPRHDQSINTPRSEHTAAPAPLSEP